MLTIMKKLLYLFLKKDMINKLLTKGYGEQFIDSVTEAFDIPSNLMEKRNDIVYFLYQKTYVYNKKTKKLIIQPHWKIIKKYKTSRGAEDALQHYRKYESFEEYPFNEYLYPTLLQTTTIRRFKVLRSDYNTVENI